MLSLEKWKFTLIFFHTLLYRMNSSISKQNRRITRKNWHTVSWNTKENTKSCSSKSSIMPLWGTIPALIALDMPTPPDLPSVVYVTFLCCTLFPHAYKFPWWTFLIQVSPKFWSYHCNLDFTFTALLGFIRASLQGICHIAWFQQLSGIVEQASIKSLLLYFYMLLKPYQSVHNAANFSCHLEIWSGLLLLQLCAGIPENNTSLGSWFELGTS